MNFLPRVTFFLTLFLWSGTVWSHKLSDQNCNKFFGEVLKPKISLSTSSLAEKHHSSLAKLQEFEAELSTIYMKFRVRGDRATAEDAFTAFEKIQNRFIFALNDLKKIGSFEKKYSDLLEQLIDSAEKHRMNRSSAGNASETLRAFYGRVRGEIGELEFAMQVPEFVTKGKLFKTVAEESSKEKSDRLLGYLAENKNADGEIDIVFKTESGKIAWCEVKNYREPLAVGEEYSKKVLAQLTKMKKFRDLVDSQIEIHLYIRNGMTAELKRQFEALGVRVY